jgi:DNA ligase-4
MHEEMDPLHQKSGCFGSFDEAPRRRDRCLDTSASHTLERLDTLLDELASQCDFSCDEVRALRTRLAGSKGRPRAQSDVLHDLFEPLSAIEAGYLSQIILRDLSPLLYPLPSATVESALNRYNANAYQTFELVEALSEWNWILPAVYRYRADLDRAFLVLEQENVLHRACDTSIRVGSGCTAWLTICAYYR